MNGKIFIVLLVINVVMAVWSFKYGSYTNAMQCIALAIINASLIVSSNKK